MAEIGKNIIENLTTAMYENSYTIYREYIQNAADSIDKAVDKAIMNKNNAVIDILIEFAKRRITIYDNAMGISQSKFRNTLSNIADSQKNPSKEKGFRGIGRLAGLAYCDKLVFRTSTKGEKKESIMEWNGAKLRQILADPKQHPSASELVDSIIECFENDCDEEEHFFEVVLDHIIPESDNLLDEHSVIEYLQAVAPVPYANTFTHRFKIHEYAKKEGLSIDEYDIQINGNPIFKPYKNNLYEKTADRQTIYDKVNDIEFRQFRTDDGRLLGWLWFAVTKYEKQIPAINKMRGIRVRKCNIQIGNEETLSYPKFYKESRGNYYFIGELFAVDAELRPNARRDYFNTNATLKLFESKIIPVFYNEFYDLYHYANRVKSSFKKTVEYQKKEVEYKEKVKNSGFIDREEQIAAEKELEIKKEAADKAKRTIQLRQKDAEKSDILNRVFKEIESTYSTNEETEEVPIELEKKNNKKYLSQSLSKYNKREQKLITKVYSIIKAILPKDMADMVVAKIQEELSK